MFFEGLGVEVVLELFLIEPALYGTQWLPRLEAIGQGLPQYFKNGCPKQQFLILWQSIFSANLLRIRISTLFNSLLCQKGQYTIQP